MSSGHCLGILLLIFGLSVVRATSNNIRLSRNIVPVSYVLSIDTYLNDATDSKFSGQVDINVQCMNATNEIVLHSKNLEIIENEIEIVETSRKNDSRKVPVRFEQDTTRELLRLRSIDDSSRSGGRRNGFEANRNYSISLKFRGNLTTDLVGYYLSSYRDTKTGRTEYLAVTHFEPTDARRAFPCFDEPDFKATFQINLRHHKDFVALSNMPLIGAPTADSSKNDDFVWSRFEPSVKMSTYLVAYCVSKFVKRTAHSKRGTEINVWSRKSVANQTKSAVDFAAKSLDYYEQFFRIDYPLRKSDLIALPDFSSGAMENWGLITFREKYLTLDNQIRIRAKFVGYSVIAHELAHQWFGNLVTMKWWSDLWLNEGFATFMASLAIEHIVPEWETHDSEQVSSILSILEVDSYNSSHPVQAVIQNPSEINEIFDWITYEKGSFVLQQLYSFLGETAFRTGVSSYLREHQYANAEQDDLWRALNREAAVAISARFSIKQIMDTWTKQNGFPLITIERLANDTLVIEQTKFSYDIENDSSKSCWFVPLTFNVAGEPYNKSRIPNRWLTCSSSAPPAKLTVSDFQTQLKNNAWYTVNNEFAYFTIVNYDDRNWDRLKRVLIGSDRTVLSEMNRVHLVTSAFSLANANRLSYTFVFDLMQFLANEDSFAVLKSGLLLLSELERHFIGTDLEDGFDNYYKSIMMPLYEKFGGLERDLSSESFQEVQKWSTIMIRACKLNIGNCTDDAFDLFETQKYQIEAESLVYSSVVQEGDEDIWHRVFKMLTETNDSNRRSTLLSALGKSKNATILNEYLKHIIVENDVIRKQDRNEVFYSVVTNRFGFETAKSFFYANIERLHETFAATPARLGSMIDAIVQRLNSQAEIAKMSKFIDDNSSKYFAKITQGVQEARELLKVRAKWQTKNSLELRNYLLNR